MFKINLLFTLFTVYINYGSSYRILCPYPTISRSHIILADTLFRALAAKGHEVTVISAFPPENPIPNYRHIMIEQDTTQEELFTKLVKNPGELEMSPNIITTIIDVAINESRNMLQNLQVQKIMSAENFDLVIMEYIGELHIGVAAHFNCPAILFSPVKPTYRLLELLGNPLALSYVPNAMYPTADLNRFTDRLLNFVFYLTEHIVIAYVTSHFSAFHSEQFPAPKYPSYQDTLNNNVASVFATHHFSQGDVRPQVPGLIEISGIQMTETPSPLPDVLQSWLDQSINGVVYFSLGSNLKMSSLPSNMLQSIINVFSKLKQNILWKSDMTIIPGLSDNVRLVQWVSQIDVLQHKNLQLFITHGGLGSINESKFYGVPVLVIPMFSDQIPNADSVVAEGWGIKLAYTDITEERLLISVNEMLGNSKYVNQVKYKSILYRDRPMTPLQTAIFWVEYIIRHKGAKHMRTNARHLNWFQLHSLDVIGFLSVVFIIWAYVSYKILKGSVRKIFGAKKIKLKQN